MKNAKHVPTPSYKVGDTLYIPILVKHSDYMSVASYEVHEITSINRSKIKTRSIQWNKEHTWGLRSFKCFVL